MRKLRNTLYITKELCYLFRDGTNVVIKEDNKELGRFPIHVLEDIVCFNYNGASPSLIRLCNENQVGISFVSPQGNFQGRFIGKTNGNVLLRRQQYRIADEEDKSLEYAKLMILAKTSNYRKILKRIITDHSNKIDKVKVIKSIDNLEEDIDLIKKSASLDSLRGMEGDSARTYFSCFNDLILQQREEFIFKGRSKRPPLDNVNAMLSFGYTILTNEIQSALETVGLDSYVGFFHTDRPGRASLALDLIEELRGYLVDRFVLRLINNNIINHKMFEYKENDTVLMNEGGREVFLKNWQLRKQEKIKHPFLEENMEIGLLPYVQSQLLARTIRGDLKKYPPFLM
ncbi:type I-C CRISPR-associated endonuclease Cas1c [Peptostreptococcus faecalis]|uniref:type I-C CRISPR-associated endonuclease Cas1c n=1 Tax=Peptostreptococcus faecalis TaxID=2045015 RepID=UPI000C7BC6D4|nr:type I-C CRISPR-associated endonuclease Cas1c [Peptostreptococcus faecalis]